MYVWSVRVLLLEHSQVLWYRRLPFTSSNQYYNGYTRYIRVSSAISNSSILEGRKVAQPERCRHSVIVLLLFTNYYASKFA